MQDLLSFTPRLLPPRRVIEGVYARLEPLEADRHGDSLFAQSMATGKEERHRYLFEPPVERDAFQKWLEEKEKSKDPLFFAVVDRATGLACGRQAFMRMEPAHGVIEIGSILWGPAMARGRLASEAFFLFASLVFDELGYRRLEWKCNNANEPSKRAALRFGFSYEGVFRQHMILKGENRDTAWFSLLDHEWLALKQSFAAWLAPENFNPQGEQKQPLRFFRS